MEFKDILNKLNKVPNINEGGCGVSAWAMYKWLEKHDKERFKSTSIVYLTQTIPPLKRVEYAINNGGNFRANSGACFHALIKIGNQHYDSTGKVWFDKNILLSAEIPKEITNTFMKSSLGCDDWSTTFNKRYIPVIESNLGIDLDVKGKKGGLVLFYFNFKNIITNKLRWRTH